MLHVGVLKAYFSFPYYTSFLSHKYCIGEFEQNCSFFFDEILQDRCAAANSFAKDVHDNIQSAGTKLVRSQRSAASVYKGLLFFLIYAFHLVFIKGDACLPRCCAALFHASWTLQVVIDSQWLFMLYSRTEAQSDDLDSLPSSLYERLVLPKHRCVECRR